MNLFKKPLANEKAEALARHLAQDARYIRDKGDLAQYNKLPLESQMAFRAIAREYAQILGINALDPERDEKVAEIREIDGVERLGTTSTEDGAPEAE